MNGHENDDKHKILVCGAVTDTAAVAAACKAASLSAVMPVVGDCPDIERKGKAMLNSILTAHPEYNNPPVATTDDGWVDPERELWAIRNHDKMRQQRERGGFRTQQTKAENRKWAARKRRK